MLQLGCCADIPVSEAARDKARKIKEAGFDYIELNFQSAAALTPAERREAVSFLEELGLPCRAMNCLLPGSLPVAGPEADLGRVREYLETAFPTARELGAKTIVFGSSGARRIPVGFPRETAWVQLVGFLRLAPQPGGMQRGEHPYGGLPPGQRRGPPPHRPAGGLLSCPAQP